MKTPLHVSIRELHARTGHYVRKAGSHRVIVTENGKPAAELVPVTTQGDEVPYFARRKPNPEFKKLADRGCFKPRPGTRDITDLISEDRDDRV